MYFRIGIAALVTINLLGGHVLAFDPAEALIQLRQGAMSEKERHLEPI
jgi:hypothetical protein